jgi:hypothetical protein
MSRLELAAILRAKAWRNYPGIFRKPGACQERVEQSVLDGLGPGVLVGSALGISSVNSLQDSFKEFCPVHLVRESL